MILRKINIIICVLAAIAASVAHATEYTSATFKVIDPVISIGGGLSTSATYKLERSVGQPAIGLSNAASWVVKGGFLYFEDAAAPTPTPTPTASVTPTSPPGNGPPGTVQPPPPAGGFPPYTIPPKFPLPVSVGKCGIADFNCDGKVDIADFSAFLYLSDFAPQENPADLNADGKISLSDTSVLFYYWSGRSVFKLPTFAELPRFILTSPGGAGGEGVRSIGQGRRAPRFGIQEESAVSLVKTATSTILALISKVINIITVLISGFLRILYNVVK